MGCNVEDRFGDVNFFGVYYGYGYSGVDVVVIDVVEVLYYSGNVEFKVKRDENYVDG